MRAQQEIQKAHDMLWCQITGDVPFVFEESARLPMHAALDVLCWVLRHDHSDGFPKVLAELTVELAKRGYTIEPIDAEDRE